MQWRMISPAVEAAPESASCRPSEWASPSPPHTDTTHATQHADMQQQQWYLPGAMKDPNSVAPHVALLNRLICVSLKPVMGCALANASAAAAATAARDVKRVILIQTLHLHALHELVEEGCVLRGRCCEGGAARKITRGSGWSRSRVRRIAIRAIVDAAASVSTYSATAHIRHVLHNLIH